jgi:hypothetical protein
MMSDQFLNIVVAMSNIYGLFPLVTLPSLTDKLFTLVCLCASVLMHLSERKHTLRGIYPFNNHTYSLLWIDRIVSYLAVIYLLYYGKIDSHSICVAAIGILMMWLGEFRYKYDPFYYTYVHSVWHISAFYLIWYMLHPDSQFP